MSYRFVTCDIREPNSWATHSLLPASTLWYSLQERSRETVRINLSSGLNAIWVTVKEWPARGSPTGCQVVASYTRTTACSGVDALHALAIYLREFEVAKVMDCNICLLAQQHSQCRIFVPRNHVRKPFRSRAKVLQMLVHLQTHVGVLVQQQWHFLKGTKWGANRWNSYFPYQWHRLYSKDLKEGHLHPLAYFSVLGIRIMWIWAQKVYLIFRKLRYMQCLHEIDESTRCFKYPDNFLVCDTGKSEFFQEHSCKEVVSVDLRSGKFIPWCWPVSWRDSAMNSGCLIDSRKTWDGLISGNRGNTYPEEIKNEPLGLQFTLFTGPRWPPMAPTSSQASSFPPPSRDLQCHLLQPPDQPHATTSLPSNLHAPPTNPPNRWPPMSPNLWLFIQIELDWLPVVTIAGDQSMREESVDVERSVCVECVVEGRHEIEVIPASWPTRRASKVTENRALSICLTTLNRTHRNSGSLLLIRFNRKDMSFERNLASSFLRFPEFF